MTGPADWVGFVRARLDEDEAGATAAASIAGRAWLEWSTRVGWRDNDDLGYPDETHWSILSVATGGEAVELAGQGNDGGGVFSEAAAQHMVRHDPARVLAEVAAKRRIVDQIAGADPHAGYITATFTAWDVLVLLAQPWAEHPDWPGLRPRSGPRATPGPPRVRGCECTSGLYGGVCTCDFS